VVILASRYVGSAAAVVKFGLNFVESAFSQAVP
jgi:hypothetical protein